MVEFPGVGDALITATPNDRNGVSIYFVQTDNKNASKVLITAPSWGESTGDTRIPSWKGQ